MNQNTKTISNKYYSIQLTVIDFISKSVPAESSKNVKFSLDSSKSARDRASSLAIVQESSRKAFPGMPAHQSHYLK